MKKLFSCPSYLILTVAVLITFSQCAKDKNCDVVITVKSLSDTTKTISNVLVKIYVDQNKLKPPPVNHSTIDTIKGYTNGAGEFKATFKFEAILNVTAQQGNITGQTIVTLKEGKTVNKTVLIQ